MKDDIVDKILEAQVSPNKLNKLIEDFLPFIKGSIAQSRRTAQSREDALTLAMLTFVNCVKTYSPEKGSFIRFTQASIRNRLIDDFRKEHKLLSGNYPVLEQNTENNLSLAEYHVRLEQEALRLEIEEISSILSGWNTSFAELSKICPKQRRTRAQCEYIAVLLLKNPVWRNQLLEKRRMPGKELCEAYGVSVKILEKYRKYIATLCIIQTGDYPRLRAFLPMNRKGGHSDE